MATRKAPAKKATARKAPQKKLAAKKAVAKQAATKRKPSVYGSVPDTHKPPPKR